MQWTKFIPLGQLIAAYLVQRYATNIQNTAIYCDASKFDRNMNAPTRILTSTAITPSG